MAAAMFGRRLPLTGAMILTGLWLAIPLRASGWTLHLMTTDGCGQILRPADALAVDTVITQLKIGIAAALIVEIAVPRVRFSAWIAISVPVAAFLLATSAVAIRHAGFLTFCDIFILTPTTTATLNVMTVAALGLFGWWRYHAT